jgi:hypothetical protein
MSNKFINILDDIGRVIKNVFTNPTAEKIEAATVSLVGVAFPQFQTLTSQIASGLLKAQSLATSANVTGDTTAMVAALALGDSQQILAAAGVTETAHQQQIVAAVQTLLSLLPSPVVSTVPAASIPTSVVVEAPVSTLIPSVKTQVSSNTLL